MKRCVKCGTSRQRTQLDKDGQCAAAHGRVCVRREASISRLRSNILTVKAARRAARA